MSTARNKSLDLASMIASVINFFDAAGHTGRGEADRGTLGRRILLGRSWDHYARDNLRVVLNRVDEISFCGRAAPRVTSSPGFWPPSELSFQEHYGNVAFRQPKVAGFIRCVTSTHQHVAHSDQVDATLECLDESTSSTTMC